MNKGLLSLFVLFWTSVPAFADGYQYSYGDNRVTKQGQIGMPGPSSSYISPGTLSKSAGGGPAGVRSGNQLPPTQWSTSVRSPGDDLYNGNNGAMRDANGGLIYRDQYLLKQLELERRRHNAELSRLKRSQPQQPGAILYKPGSNGSHSSYGQ